MKIAVKGYCVESGVPFSTCDLPIFKDFLDIIYGYMFLIAVVCLFVAL
ncbi:MAG: hypothetical protein LBJ83_02465 [Oscillospiraceae bacterium]|nr:hypothetical protein [Oscillospiraceae bacterium]